MEHYLKLITEGRTNRIVVPTGACNGSYNFHKDSDSEPEENADAADFCGTNYATVYQQRELKLYEEATFKGARTGTLSMVETVNDLMGEGSAGRSRSCQPDTIQRVYQNYPIVNQLTRNALPIDTKKEDIMNTLNVSNVVIIQGETGCGKTTQVPQFILDTYREKQEYCNIVVTQPRKLAAVSVAKRVCNERGWECGSVVGYQVGLEKRAGNDTILTYMTTGVLLQKIISRKDLNEFTHIIIDEVHERTQEMDFLLIIIRRFLNTNSMGVRIILMSATFETDKFAEYFKTVSAEIISPASIIQVSKQNQYDKSIHYIEELGNLGEIPEPSVEVGISRAVYDIFVKLILALKNVDDVGHIGHVLVFLPGQYEIEEAYKRLMQEAAKGNGQFVVVPLHSMIPSHEQSRVFDTPPPGHRKIILSTNIAESSITVPDVVYVIDFCLTKTLEVDPETQYRVLKTCWASHTNCDQRAGRVGRVSSGRVYRLVSHDFYQTDMPQEIPPEILRAPIERLVLLTKKLDLVDLPQSILALAMDPPDLFNIRASIKYLKEAGALLPTCRGEFMESDGDLTMLGKVMCALPLDVKLAKMICLGNMFGVFDECIIMATGCALTRIFTTPFQERMPAYRNRLMYANNAGSDLIALLWLYNMFDANCRAGAATQADIIHYCKRNYLSYRALLEWQELIKETKERLLHMHIKARVMPMDDIYKQVIMKIVIAGAFYPNYFTRSCDGGQVDEKEVCRQIKGLNPFNTVYFHNMDTEQPGPLYEQRIREIMRPVTEDISVYFDNTTKVYVSFNDTWRKEFEKNFATHEKREIDGKISLNVYKAVKLRQLKANTSFPAMNKADAWTLAKKLQIAKFVDGEYKLIRKKKQKPGLGENDQKTDHIVIPNINENIMSVRISHAIDAGHFYAQLTHPTYQRNIENIAAVLNGPTMTLKRLHVDEVDIGDMCACLYEDDKYYRCRVIGKYGKHNSMPTFQVLYVDYGNTESVHGGNLFELSPYHCNIPPQAIECVLSEVRPAVNAMNPKGIWTDRANKFFTDATDEIELRADVYSVVDSIVSVELFSDNSASINKLLVLNGYAEKREESYLSKENHQQRLMSCSVQNMYLDDEGELNCAEPTLPIRHVPAPKATECFKDICLKGPISPLEMKVFSKNKKGERASIEYDSVNCVLLDSEPEDPHERLLVAGTVSQSQYTGSIKLRNTTMFPNIHGLPALIALIFCPVMKLKASNEGTHYVSALCGLGVDSRKRAINSENDLNFIFDTKMDVEDIIEVNLIRYCMNRLMEEIQQCSENMAVPKSSFDWMMNGALKKLLNKKRESIKRELVAHADSWTKSAYEGRILKSSNGRYNIENDIWALHSIVELVKEGKDMENAMLRRHVLEMDDMAVCNTEMQAVECKLCEIKIDRLNDLRMHLASKGHIANVNHLNADLD